MKGYVANTDFDWFEFLRARAELDAVNFWQPSGGKGFHVLSPGEPLFFRLKAPHRAIAGFGMFLQHSILPAWLAWEAFEAGNGAADFPTMRARIEKYRHGQPRDPAAQYEVGCIILGGCLFFDRDAWIRELQGWADQIVAGKSFELEHGEGARIWRECLERADAARRGDRPGAGGGLVLPAFGDGLAGGAGDRTGDGACGSSAGGADRGGSARGGAAAGGIAETPGEGARYGEGYVVQPRLGQGAFRIAVTDAYGRACAVSNEHSLPVLDAAHVRPYADGGPHSVTNGILLRTDIHRLFDRGYVTVTPDYKFRVSQRLRKDWENGRVYYELEGREIALPKDQGRWPDREGLAWHEGQVFLG